MLWHGHGHGMVVHTTRRATLHQYRYQGWPYLPCGSCGEAPQAGTEGQEGHVHGEMGGWRGARVRPGVDGEQPLRRCLYACVWPSRLAPFAPPVTIGTYIRSSLESRSKVLLLFSWSCNSRYAFFVVVIVAAVVAIVVTVGVVVMVADTVVVDTVLVDSDISLLLLRRS